MTKTSRKINYQIKKLTEIVNHFCNFRVNEDSEQLIDEAEKQLKLQIHETVKHCVEIALDEMIAKTFEDVKADTAYTEGMMLAGYLNKKHKYDILDTLKNRL